MVMEVAEKGRGELLGYIEWIVDVASHVGPVATTNATGPTPARNDGNMVAATQEMAGGGIDGGVRKSL
jgi:hypothetical protein